MEVICTDAARRAIRKCALRAPGAGVTLTDDEVVGLFDWLTAMGRQDALDHVDDVETLIRDVAKGAR